MHAGGRAEHAGSEASEGVALQDVQGTNGRRASGQSGLVVGVEEGQRSFR